MDYTYPLELFTHKNTGILLIFFFINQDNKMFEMFVIINV